MIKRKAISTIVPANPGFEVVTYFREPKGKGFDWHLLRHPVVAWSIGDDVWPCTTSDMDPCPPFMAIESEGCSLTALLRPDGGVQEMNYAFEIKPSLAEWIEHARKQIEVMEYEAPGEREAA